MVNSVERRIMWGDLDALGIVFYPRYYEWIDASGHLFFESLGMTLVPLWQSRGIQFGLVETSCRYFKPGRYHDHIRIETLLDELAAKTIVLRHRIIRVRDEVLLVEGLEKRICLDVSDPENFRALHIPEDIRARLEQALISRV